MPSKSSSGYDHVSSILLKKLSPIIINCLTLMVNQSLITGIFPESLKKAKVVPIYKKNDKSKFENYRPISILPTISKLFERVAYNQLSDYFNENNLFYSQQYGFRAHHSTEHAILELSDRIISAMDNKQTPMTIFLDLSKAFDTLNHDILLTKLSYYGINNSANTWFKNYLNNRTQYVEFENHQSVLLSNNIGIPQGSILGPLLFNIYINDISNSTNYFKIIQYADDTSLFCNYRNQTDSAQICDELHNINKWLTYNRLCLNISKTKYQIFHTKHKNIVAPNIILNNTIIQKVPDFDFLGVVFNENMNWQSHITKVANKMNRNLGLINKLKHFVPTYVLKILYDSLILPHLYYGNLAWGTNTQRLSKLQKKAIRIISCGKYNAHTEPLFKKHHILKIDDIYRLNCLKFYFKYVHKKLPLYFQSLNLKKVSEIHSYNTRRPNQLIINKTKHKFADKCIRVQLPIIINSTTSNVTNKIMTHSFKGYVTYITNDMLDKYQTLCRIANCYICSNDQS